MTWILRVVWNLLRLPLAPFWALGRLLSRPRAAWVHVRLRPQVVELIRPLPLIVRLLPATRRNLPTPLHALRRLARHVSADSSVRGVLLEIPPLSSGWAACDALREIVRTIRASGKQVVAYLPQGGGNREVYVATSADRILVGPQAILAPIGLAAETRYVRPLLDKLGVEVEVEARGDYKSALEPFVRDSMSAPQREQINALLESTNKLIMAALLERPGMDEARAHSLFDQGLLRPEEAIKSGLVDGSCYEDELPNILAGPEHVRTKLVRASRYHSWKETRFFVPVVPRPYIAVVQIHGKIATDGPAASRNGATVSPVVSTLRAVRRDRRALGVVLHIDSPGGSGLASDLIHREVVRLKEKKPVIACMGDVAASGGYYIAAPAHAIVAQPGSLTGSIGVLSAKFVARKLLDMLGIRTETIRTAPHADMFSPARSLDDAERRMLEREMESFYGTFLEIVAKGRNKSIEEVDELARGRVWSGSDAAKAGLVDRLGGLDAALDEVWKRLPPIPDRFKSLVQPCVIQPRRIEIPPPEPPGPVAAWMSIAGQLAPEIGDAVSLAMGPDRVLMYALGIPRIT